MGSSSAARLTIRPQIESYDSNTLYDLVLNDCHNKIFEGLNYNYKDYLNLSMTCKGLYKKLITKNPPLSIVQASVKLARDYYTFKITPPGGYHAEYAAIACFNRKFYLESLQNSEHCYAVRLTAEELLQEVIKKMPLEERIQLGKEMSGKSYPRDSDKMQKITEGLLFKKNALEVVLNFRERDINNIGFFVLKNIELRNPGKQANESSVNTTLTKTVRKIFARNKILITRIAHFLSNVEKTGALHPWESTH